MNRRHIAAVVCFVGVALFLAGCAKPPTEELQRAESALTKAREADAPTLAAESFMAAEGKLGEGKGMVDSKKYKEAVPVLADAERLADIARQEALDAKRAAEAAEQPEPVAEQPETPAGMQHAVVWGDCLSCIAARTSVYGNASRWREIYDANRDVISNPDLIFPGQKLVIPM